MVDMEEYGCDNCTNPYEDCATCPWNEQRKQEWQDKKDSEFRPIGRGVCAS